MSDGLTGGTSHYKGCGAKARRRDRREAARSNVELLHSTFNTQHSTLNIEHSPFEPRTSNLGPRTSNLGPRTSNLEPRTSNRSLHFLPCPHPPRPYNARRCREKRSRSEAAGSFSTPL